MSSYDGFPEAIRSDISFVFEAFKSATLPIVGLNIPPILAVEPVRESSAWDENPPNQIHRVVRRLVRRAKGHVPIEMVLCVREFDSTRVFQTLSDLGVNYLIPKRTTSTEKEMIETMESDGEDVAVESASVHVESGEHSMQFLYDPSTKGDGTAVFATNLRVEPEEPSRSVGATAAAGRSKTSTSPSSTTSLRRRPRRTTACGCSTSCSRYYSTISGGSPTSC